MSPSISPQGASEERIPPADLADYVIEIGGTLVAYGCPSYRLEEVIRVVAEIEGYTAQAFAIPTGLFVSITVPGQTTSVFRMIRVKEWGTNLDRLVLVDAIFNDVAADRITIQQARRRLRDLDKHPPPYSRALTWTAIAAVSAAAAVFFRGGALEVLVAGTTGIAVALLASLIGPNLNGRFLVDLAGGLLAALFPWTLVRLGLDLSQEVVVLSAVIVLVPGMTLTTGLAELAQKNLVSGAARLMEAFVAFLSILFGIALAIGIEHMVSTDTTPPPIRQALSLPFQALALVAASLGIAVIFAVPRRYLGAALASGAIGYIATALGTRYLPGYVSAFAAALAVCLFANGLARATDRPAQLYQLPGMMLLVPGSFGFMSLEDFLRGDFLNGAAKGFSMLLIAGALVTGILLANALLPAKKLL
ncbi:MAG TPA: threonine/serine exporter family protein [Polyangiaceae bacterium]|nr:threonine/serine exporter family protein [Polyangiaceae bacterium]